jgi:hypothetical protein
VACLKTFGGFIVGLLPGMVLGALAVQLGPAGFADVVQAHILPYAKEGVAVLHENLRGSLFPFLLLLVVYGRQLVRLRQQLGCPRASLEEALRGEQIVDLCASLFFGVGVIWTAIGMRDALIQALGSPGTSIDSGAFDVLQRMVDGGILLALSTTIVGGVGGYLMRVGKSALVGQQLNRLYMHASQAPLLEGLASVKRIEQVLYRALPAEHDGSGNQV